MDKQIDFELTTSYLLARVSTAFRNSFERQMALIDLHAGQVFVLIELWKEDGLRQIDIATRLNLAAPTVNKTVGGLEEVNLVKIEKGSKGDKDGRVRRVYLTAKGHAIRETIERQWLDLEVDFLAGFREPEIVNLKDLLARLLASFTGRPTNDDEQ